MSSQPLRVLLVEDEDIGGVVARILGQVHGHHVTWVKDPAMARDCYARLPFDVVIVDLLFQMQLDEFRGRLDENQVRLTDSRLLTSGLSVVRDLRRLRRDTPVIVWSSSEENRRLLLLFAYEELAVRAFCSKRTGDPAYRPLGHALRAAVEGRSFTDPVLTGYLPAPGKPSLADTILCDRARLAIWRALALGAQSRGEIQSMINYAKGTIANLVPKMLDDLARLDPGMRGRAAMLTVARFADSNRAFFLDDTIRDIHPDSLYHRPAH